MRLTIRIAPSNLSRAIILLDAEAAEAMNAGRHFAARICIRMNHRAATALMSFIRANENNNNDKSIAEHAENVRSSMAYESQARTNALKC